MMNFILILSGFLMLFTGGKYLLNVAVSIAERFAVPKVIIGITVVSLATSMPELVVSFKAALQNKNDLALGNVIGSNIANIGLVLATTLFFTRIQIRKIFYKIYFPYLLISALLLFLMIAFDAKISIIEGFVLLFLLVVFFLHMIYYHRLKKAHQPTLQKNKLYFFKVVFFLCIGITGLWWGAELLIKGVVNIAQNFGLSEAIISSSVVAFGTSVPELTASIMAAVKKEKSISLGNLIGSNIFNILLVLGGTATITPMIAIDIEILHQSIFWMLGFTLSLLPLSFLFKQGLDFKAGFLLLVAYVFFVYYLMI